MTSRHLPLPGWVALPFLLLLSVCSAAPQRGREASLDLQRLGGRSLHVARELPKVNARRVLSLEHTRNLAARIDAALSERPSEVSGERNGR